MMDLKKKYIGYVSVKVKIRRAIWNIVAFILFKPFITNVFRLWRNMILKSFGADIEWDANVYASTKIWAPWNLKMGHRACLGPDVICYNQDLVVLKDDAIVSQYSFLCTAGHDTHMMNTASASLIIAPIVLEERAWVGAKAFVGMGVRIGEDAIVGATASVFKDVKPLTIVGGNPAKYIKDRIIEK